MDKSKVEEILKEQEQKTSYREHMKAFESVADKKAEMKEEDPMTPEQKKAAKIAKMKATKEANKAKKGG